MDSRTPREQQGATPQRRAAPASGQQRPAGQSGGSPTRNPRKKQKRERTPSESRWFRAIIMVIATVSFCVFMAFFVLQSANDLFGLKEDNTQEEIVIPENATISQIANILADAGIVDQPLTFRLYAGLKYDDEDMSPGNYLLEANMAYDQILDRIIAGNQESNEVRITFIEGMTVYDIARELEDEGVCEADAFLDHLQSAEFDFQFVDQLPDSSLRYRRLEGYIFPDTYDFFYDENVNSVALKFLRNFDTKITQQMRDRMLDLNLSLDETITLASVIQKEAGKVEELGRVSSVFHNRLSIPEVYPKLQSDVTKIYVNNYIKPFLSQTNQTMYDAYNTYECEGLPVGPICNPGEAAINAALYPVDTPYYFFVTDVEEEFYYAETAEEHYRNVYTASQVQGEGEIHGIDTE